MGKDLAKLWYGRWVRGAPWDTRLPLGAPVRVMKRGGLLMLVCMLLALTVGPSAVVSSSLAAASVGDVELGVPYGAWESPEIEEIAVPTDFAESAMPSHKGLKTIAVGLVLLLLFLTLTEWRVKGSQKNGSLLSRIQDAQDSTAALLNSPVQELNAHLERDGKAMSVRLLLFMTFIICLFIGTMELAFSLGRRYTQRASFPVLKRAQVVGTFAALMIFLSLLGIFGAFTAWKHVGESIYI